MDTKTFVFQVRGREDASVGLSQLPANFEVSTTEIVIGASGNSRTVIRDGVNGTELHGVDSHDVLSTTELRWFWVQWEGSTYTVGEGETVGEKQLLTYSMTSAILVSSVAVTTSGNAYGEWKVYTDGETDTGGNPILSQQTNVYLMLAQCWSNGTDCGQTINQHRVNI